MRGLWGLGPVDKSEGFGWGGLAQGPSIKVRGWGAGLAQGLSINVRDSGGWAGPGPVDKSEGLGGQAGPGPVDKSAGLRGRAGRAGRPTLLDFGKPSRPLKKKPVI